MPMDTYGGDDDLMTSPGASVQSPIELRRVELDVALAEVARSGFHTEALYFYVAAFVRFAQDMRAQPRATQREQRLLKSERATVEALLSQASLKGSVYAKLAGALLSTDVDGCTQKASALCAEAEKMWESVPRDERVAFSSRLANVRVSIQNVLLAD